MKRKWIEETAEGMEILMNFLIVFCILNMIFSVIPGKLQPSIWQYAALAVVPHLLYRVRKKVNNFLLFVMIHILLLTAGFLIIPTDWAERIGFGIFLVFYVLYSLIIRLIQSRVRENSVGIVPAGIFMGISFITSIYMGQEQTGGYILNTALLYIFLMFLDMYLNNFTGYVEVNKSSCAHVPEQNMFRAGFAMILVFSLLVLLILGLVPNDGLVAALSRGLKELLRILLTAIAAILGLFAGKEGISEEITAETAAVQPSLPVASDTPYWIELLGQILQKLMIAALIILICYLLYRAIRALIRRFYDALGQEEAQSQTGEEPVEKKERLNRRTYRKRSDKSMIPALTAEGKIRRIYKKTVERYPFVPTSSKCAGDEQAGNYAAGRDRARSMLEAALITCSARELAAYAAGTEKEEAFHALAVLYEKARYGKGCDREDIRAAAALSKIVLKKQA